MGVMVVMVADSASLEALQVLFQSFAYDINDRPPHTLKPCTAFDFTGLDIDAAGDNYWRIPPSAIF